MSDNNILDSFPCLIITYSRPEICINLIDELVRQGCKRVYIALDFAKTREVISTQKMLETLEEKYQYKFEIFKVWRRTENLGVAVSVITAIDWFFAYEICGMVLEDDLVIHKNFLAYTFKALEYLESEKDIFAVSGSNFFPTLHNESFLTDYFIGWGWGTWKFQWQKAKSSYMQKIKRAPITLNKIDNFWNVGAYRCSIGKVNTWDIELTKYVRDNNLKCLVAPINMVSNIGFDKHATNTTTQDFPLGLPTSEIMLSNINFDQMIHNKNFDNALERLVFHIKFRHKFLSLLSFIFDRKVFLKNIKNSTLSERLKLITLP